MVSVQQTVLKQQVGQQKIYVKKQLDLLYRGLAVKTVMFIYVMPFNISH